jgi:hypothetical protein
VKALVKAAQLLRRCRPIGLLWLVAALGLLARFIVMLESIGSNDMVTWQHFANVIARTSVGHAYDTEVLYNHPPLMGLMGGGLFSLSRALGCRFEVLFKLPMLLADAGVAYLIYRSWRGRGVERALVALACFCWSPISISITGYHGNTDSLCAGLTLLSAVLLDGEFAFLGGLALAASINVKLIPCLLIPTSMACLKSWKERRSFAFGLSLGVIPFLPYLLWHWQGFHDHALAYRSYPGEWGITGILARVGANRHLAELCGWMNRFWVEHGSLGVLLWPVLLASLELWFRRRWSARELSAAVMAGFLVLTPGWGIQYAIYPVALLFSANIERAIAYSVFGGLYTLIVYASLWTGSRPFYSSFYEGQPEGGLIIGFLTWLVAGRAVIDLLRSKFERADRFVTLARQPS